MFRRNRERLGVKSYPFWIFIAPITIFVAVGFPLIPRYPIPIAVLLVTFSMIFVPLGLYGIYGSFIVGRYVRKHDFQLWKKSKSTSLKAKREAYEAIQAMCMRTPCLGKHLRYSNKLAFTLLSIWTLIFLGVFSFIILSAMWN